MATSKFASGRFAISLCDVCGQRYKLHQLKSLTIKTKATNILACPECWNPDHPQLLLGMYPVVDGIALRNPRPDIGKIVSRDDQYGWNPVGISDYLNLGYPNNLVATTTLGSVTVI